MVPFNALKGFSSVPCWRGWFFCEKQIPSFWSSAAIKQERRLCRILGGASFCCLGGGCGYVVTVITVEVVGDGGVGRFE